MLHGVTNKHILCSKYPEELPLKFSKSIDLNGARGNSLSVVPVPVGSSCGFFDNHSVLHMDFGKSTHLKTLTSGCTRINSVAFDSQGKHMLVNDQFLGLKVWNLTNLMPVSHFTQSVGDIVKSQFYYMDNFVLSSTNNRLLIHKCRLDSMESKPVKTIYLSELKAINDFSANNSAFSDVAIIAGSDKVVRVVDFSIGKVSLEFDSGHYRSIRRVIQCGSRGSCLVDGANVDLMATIACGDGAKIWDLRQGGRSPCQRFSWPNDSARLAKSNGDFSPCGRYLALVATGTAQVLIFDIRKTGSFVKSICSSGGEINDVAFNSTSTRLITTSNDGFINVYQ